MRNLPQRVGKSADATCRTCFGGHINIIAGWGGGSCRRRTSVDARAHISLCALSFTQAGEVIVDVLLGCDGDAVASGGAEAPILQGFEHLAVDCRSQALDHNFLDDVALFVDRDFDNDVALKTAQFVGRDVRDREKRPAARDGPLLRSKALQAPCPTASPRHGPERPARARWSGRPLRSWDGATRARQPWLPLARRFQVRCAFNCWRESAAEVPGEASVLPGVRLSSANKDAQSERRDRH